MAIDSAAKRYALFDEGITKPDNTTSAFDRMAFINFYYLAGGPGPTAGNAKHGGRFRNRMRTR